MNLIKDFDSAFKKETTGSTSEFTLILENVLRGKYLAHESQLLAKHIENIFFDIEITQRNSVLFLLNKLDQDIAYSIAKKELETAYNATRNIGSYLLNVLTSIDNNEHFLRSSGAMDIEKNLRIAYALINNIQLIDGDFNPHAHKNQTSPKQY